MHQVFKWWQGSEEEVPTKWSLIAWPLGGDELCDTGYEYDDVGKAVIIGPELDRRRIHVAVRLDAAAAKATEGVFSVRLEQLRPGDTVWKSLAQGSAILNERTSVAAVAESLVEVRAGTRLRVRARANMTVIGAAGPWFVPDDACWAIVAL